MSSEDERRQWSRRLLSTTILFKPVEAPGGNPFRSGQMRDVSDGGISFDTDAPPPDGALIDMFFKEHATAADRRVRGRVVWLRPGNDGLQIVGVSFAR